MEQVSLGLLLSIQVRTPPWLRGFWPLVWNGVKQSKTTSKCLKFDVSLSNHKIKLHNLTAVAVQLI